MKKRVPALLLLLCFLFSAPAFAADTVAGGECGKDGGNVSWTLNSAGTLSISGTGEMEDYYYDNAPWSGKRGDIRRVEIQRGVTYIGKYAFYECGSLTSADIPESVTSIGNGAFYGCGGLTSVNIPASVTSIGCWAFEWCGSLTSVSIPAGVTSISNEAFHGCSSLTSVDIPESVTSIGNWAFDECVSLTDVYYEGTEAQWDAIEIFDDNDPLSFTTIHCNTSAIVDSGEFGKEGGSLTWTLDSDGTLTISGTGEMPDYDYGDAPWYSKHEDILRCEIQSGVTSIGRGAFRVCGSLTNVDIPESVVSIGDYAFYGCSSLTGVSIPEGVTSIAYGAFGWCGSLTDISVASGNTYYTDIDGVLFSKDTAVLHTFPAGREGAYMIPEGVTSIGHQAFYGCGGLTGVGIPESVTSINNWAFGWCGSLTDISVASGNSDYTDIDGVLFSKDTTVLYAFPGGREGAYMIPESVTSIGECAFYGCGGLTSVSIPEGVTSIEAYAFYECGGLTDVYYGGTEAQWSVIEISYNNNPLASATIHYK